MISDSYKSLVSLKGGEEHCDLLLAGTGWECHEGDDIGCNIGWVNISKISLKEEEFFDMLTRSMLQDNWRAPTLLRPGESSRILMIILPTATSCYHGVIKSIKSQFPIAPPPRCFQVRRAPPPH